MSRMSSERTAFRREWIHIKAKEILRYAKGSAASAKVFSLPKVAFCTNGTPEQGYGSPQGFNPPALDPTVHTRRIDLLLTFPQTPWAQVDQSIQARLVAFGWSSTRRNCRSFPESTAPAFYLPASSMPVGVVPSAAAS